MAGWLRARTIVEEADVSAAVDRFRKKFRRFEEAFDALKWLLARRCDAIPHIVRPTDGIDYCLYRQASDALAGTPSILVLYTYDDNQVVLISIDAQKAEPEED